MLSCIGLDRAYQDLTHFVSGGTSLVMTSRTQSDEIHELFYHYSYPITFYFFQENIRTTTAA